jgi:hypothetical protein
MFGGKGSAPKDTLLLVTGSVVEFLDVSSLTAEAVSTSRVELPRSNLLELVRPEGGRVFLAAADLPARIQAEDVARLRRSAILGSLFNSKTPDLGRVPWQLWVLIGALVLALGIAAAR